MFRLTMPNKGTHERKLPGGIALKPSLWARVDRLATAQKKSRNQVMEEVLSLYLPDVPEVRNLQEESQYHGTSGVFG